MPDQLGDILRITDISFVSFCHILGMTTITT